MIKICKLLILLGLTSIVMGCKTNNFDSSSETGVVKTTLTTKSQISFNGGDDIDLSQIKLPPVQDFRIEILSNGEVVKSFEKYSDIEQNLELKLGKYLVKSAYGDVAKSGWNCTYYAGEGEFILSTINPQATINLECKLRSSFAFAKFDDKFRKAFSDFSVEFSTEKTAEPLIFIDGEKRIASFHESEKLWIVVNATLKSTEKKIKYGITHLEGVKAGDLNVFNFTVNDGKVSAQITVDNGFKLVEKNIDLDPEWVDDRFTKIYSSFDESSPILFVSGMPSAKSYDVVVSSNVGLKNLFIHFDEQFANDLGGIAKIDMLNLTPELQTLIDTKVGAVLKVTADGKGYRLNLSGCKDKLPLRNGQITQYQFGIEAVDILETSKRTGMDAFVIEIKVNTFKNERVWNRFAYIPAPYIVGGDASEILDLPFEYWVKEGNGSWVSRGNLIGNDEVRLNDLKPGTNYFTKVMFEESILSECAFKTHTELQIPNNDFSQFRTETCGGTRFPYLNYEFTNIWATLNALTVDKTEVGWSRSFPCVRVIDGAAEISTIGYGKNESGQGAQINHAWTQSLEKKDKWSRTWGNYAVGKIFLGTYSVAIGEIAGREFDSKPISVKFRYKFSCKNSNGPWTMQLRLLASGGEEVGRTEFSGSNANEGNFLDTTVPIKYNANYNSKSITNMELYFVSQTGSVAANDGNLNELYGSHREGTADFWGTPTWKESLDSRTCGNVLTIDDVIMVYPSNPEDYQIR